MHLFTLTAKQVCDLGFIADLAPRSPADPRKVVPSLPAPVRPGQRVITPSNEIHWTAIGAFLVDRVVNP